MRRSVPTRVVIPAIKVDSALLALGLQQDGSLEVPSTGFPAGWFTGAPTPGELGPAIIAGHVHWQGRWGVFRRLGTLERGDTIVVDRSDGSVATFRVTRTEQVSKAAFPTKQVYGNIAHAGLRLMTCGGLDPATRTYEASVIVFADLVQARS
jgi:LPXTG-site transpeptidase (sortase) family protein